MTIKATGQSANQVIALLRGKFTRDQVLLGLESADGTPGKYWLLTGSKGEAKITLHGKAYTVEVK